MSKVDAFLGDQSHNDSRLSFGLEVANAYRAKDESYIWLARGLAYRAGQLLTSKNTSDIAAVSQINSDYSRTTHAAICEKLENKVDQLPTLRPLHWLQQASVRDIALFTIANRELQLEHQSALSRDQPHLEHIAMEGLERLVDAGYYPRAALPIYARTIEEYGRWKALDSFESGAKILSGYCSHRTIAFANMYKNPAEFTGVSRVLARAVLHELSHGVDTHGGRGFQFQPSNSRGDFRYLSFMSEAMAEHNSAVHEAAHKKRADMLDMHTIHPTKRSDSKHDLHIYTPERTLCAALELDPVELAHLQITSISTLKGIKQRTHILQHMTTKFRKEANIFTFADSYDDTPSRKRTEFVDSIINFVQDTPRPEPTRPATSLWHRIINRAAM